MTGTIPVLNPISILATDIKPWNKGAGLGGLLIII